MRQWPTGVIGRCASCSRQPFGNTVAMVRPEPWAAVTTNQLGAAGLPCANVPGHGHGWPPCGGTMARVHLLLSCGRHGGTCFVGRRQEGPTAQNPVASFGPRFKILVIFTVFAFSEAPVPPCLHHAPICGLRSTCLLPCPVSGMRTHWVRARSQRSPRDSRCSMPSCQAVAGPWEP